MFCISADREGVCSDPHTAPIGQLQANDRAAASAAAADRRGDGAAEACGRTARRSQSSRAPDGTRLDAVHRSRADDHSAVAIADVGAGVEERSYWLAAAAAGHHVDGGRCERLAADAQRVGQQLVLYR